MPQQTKKSTENIKHQNIEYLAWDEHVSHIRHLKNTETAHTTFRSKCKLTSVKKRSFEFDVVSFLQ